MGGGRSKFLPKELQQQKYFGKRQDKRNLIKEWLEINRTAGAHSAYVSDRSQLMSLNTSEIDYLLGKKLIINCITSQIF